MRLYSYSIFVILFIIITYFIIFPILQSTFKEYLYIIKFYNSDLIIKRGLVGRSKRFEIQKIIKIEIDIMKDTTWCPNILGCYSNIWFNLKILSLNQNKIMIFRFFKEFYAKRKNFNSIEITKQKSIELRKEFEEKLMSLNILFPEQTFLLNEKTLKFYTKKYFIFNLLLIIVMIFGIISVIILMSSIYI